jgi:hypothetical protein
MAMIAITTNNSINVNAERDWEDIRFTVDLQIGACDKVIGLGSLRALLILSNSGDSRLVAALNRKVHGTFTDSKHDPSDQLDHVK